MHVSCHKTNFKRLNIYDDIYIVNYDDSRIFLSLEGYDYKAFKERMIIQE